MVEPRIGSGQNYMWGGGAVLSIALFLGIAGAGGSASASALAGLFALLGASLVFVGFWKGLYNKIELRLIDIQNALSGEPQQPAAEPPQASKAKPAEDYLG